MTPGPFEDEVAAMLRRRSADIEPVAEEPVGEEPADVALADFGVASDTIEPRTLAPTPSPQRTSRSPGRSRRLPALAALAAAAGLIVGIVVIDYTRSPEQVDMVAAGVEPNPTAPASDRAAAEPSSTAAPALRPTPGATPTSLAEATAIAQSGIATDDDGDEATVLLPGDGWRVEYGYSQLYGNPGEPTERLDFMATTDQGPFGPTVWAYYLVDADYRRVGSPGGTYRDAVLSDGRVVRIRDDDRPTSVVNVFEAPGGAAVAIGYSVGDDELLAIIEDLTFDDRGAVIWTGAPLPQDLEPVDLGVPEPHIMSYNMARGEKERLEVTIFPGETWQKILNARSMHPDASMTSVGGQPALAFGYGTTSRDDPGVLYSHRGRTYLVRMGRWDPSDEYATESDALALLEGLTEYAQSDLDDELGLRPRAEVFGAWLTETPLPESSDLDWLLDGPPTTEVDEAYFAQQVFHCAWVGEWVATGDPAALAEMAAEHDWPTARILAETGPEGSADLSWMSPGFTPDTLVDGPTPESRTTDLIRQNCGFLLTDLPTGSE